MKLPQDTNADIGLHVMVAHARAGQPGPVVDGLRPAHVQQIKQLGQGECVLVWEADDDANRQNDVFVGRVEPTDAELRVFTGT